MVLTKSSSHERPKEVYTRLESGRLFLPNPNRFWTMYRGTLLVLGYRGSTCCTAPVFFDLRHRRQVTPWRGKSDCKADSFEKTV